jgi:SpoVK/Ycf46/Vps4 family AAA+-type ATPase
LTKVTEIGLYEGNPVPDTGSMDDEVLKALELAVDAAPDNVALRLHLAEQLAQAQRHDQVIEHASVVLLADPANLKALELAATSGRVIGDPRAGSWQALAAALGGSPSKQTPIPTDGPTAPVESLEDAALGAELDNFLDGLLGPPPERVTLADIGGLEQVKKRLEVSFLAPLRNPEFRAAYGKSLRGGLLLYGPPGCGKTHIARAVAGELDARFFTVALHDVLDMWMGESERKLHEMFETVRRNAPAVMFFDEVDAIGFKRSNLTTGSGGRNVVVQLLTELDSIGSDNEGVFVIGATNQPWDVDSALRRPGRFDRTVLVLPPDEAARLTILQTMWRDKPTGHVDFGRVAKLTDGFSGADLRLLCESATEAAMEQAYQRGEIVPVESAHFDAALRTVRPSTRPWFETAGNYAMFANKDGQYDDLMQYMKANKLL